MIGQEGIVGVLWMATLVIWKNVIEQAAELPDQALLITLPELYLFRAHLSQIPKPQLRVIWHLISCGYDKVWKYYLGPFHSQYTVRMQVYHGTLNQRFFVRSIFSDISKVFNKLDEEFQSFMNRAGLNHFPEGLNQVWFGILLLLEALKVEIDRWLYMQDVSCTINLSVRTRNHSLHRWVHGLHFIFKF